MTPRAGRALTFVVAVTLFACAPESAPAGRSNVGFMRSVPTLDQLAVPIRAYAEEQREWAFTSIGGRSFCGFEPLGFQRGTTQDRVYVWLFCQEFTATSDPSKEGSGSNSPAVIVVDKRSMILGHESPRAGTYADDVTAMFPAALVPVVFEFHSVRVEDRVWLPASPSQSAKEFFGRSDL